MQTTVPYLEQSPFCPYNATAEHRFFFPKGKETKSIQAGIIGWSKAKTILEMKLLLTVYPCYRGIRFWAVFLFFWLSFRDSELITSRRTFPVSFLLKQNLRSHFMDSLIDSFEHLVYAMNRKWQATKKYAQLSMVPLLYVSHTMTFNTSHVGVSTIWWQSTVSKDRCERKEGAAIKRQTNEQREEKQKRDFCCY